VGAPHKKADEDRRKAEQEAAQKGQDAKRNEDAAKASEKLREQAEEIRKKIEESLKRTTRNGEPARNVVAPQAPNGKVPNAGAPSKPDSKDND